MRRSIRMSLLIACALALPAAATAQEVQKQLEAMGIRAETAAAAQAVAEAEAVRAVEAADAEKANSQFLGFQWGMGVAVSVDLESGPRVESASIVNGVVRVDERNDIIPRIFLETHKFFPGAEVEVVSKTGKELKAADGNPVKVAVWGHGPFVGIQSSGENVIEAFAAGYMVGWRQELDSDNSFNIGLGLVVDPKAQVLGDGVEVNQPPPAGETDARLKKEPRIGVTLVYSFTF